MDRKKVLVCGATGFIGRNAAERLARREDLEVYGVYHKKPPFSNDRIKMIYADLTLKEDVNRALKGIDVLIQAAATTSGAKDIVSKPFVHVTDNVVINSLIFRSAYENKVSHLLFPSCSIMYHPSDAPLKESDLDYGQDPIKSYFGAGLTKMYLEKMCEFFSGLGSTKFTAFRHSNIYGPYDKFDLDKSHVFGATITKVMAAQDAITVWGSGEEERDLLYVSDLIDFIELAIDEQKSQFELVNVGYGSSIAIRDLVQKIIKISGKNLEIKYDLTKPTIKTKLCLDSSKARELFDWHPKTSLDEGISKTLEWYKDNIRIS